MICLTLYPELNFCIIMLYDTCTFFSQKRGGEDRRGYHKFTVWYDVFNLFLRIFLVRGFVFPERE